MSLVPSFVYRKLGDFTYHVLSDPGEIKAHLTEWILQREWEHDHQEAPNEHWTVEWMEVFPKMEFSLEIIRLDDIRPHPDLMGVEEFLAGLQERVADREWSVLCGVSIAPLLVNRADMQLMDGYTRYMLLKKYSQRDVYAYIGTA